MNHNDLAVNYSSNRTVPDAKLIIKKLCKHTSLEFKQNHCQDVGFKLCITMLWLVYAIKFL